MLSNPGYTTIIMRGGLFYFIVVVTFHAFGLEDAKRFGRKEYKAMVTATNL